MCCAVVHTSDMGISHRKSEEGRIRAAENEKSCMERDLQCLKDFTENNVVHWDGKMVYAM